MKLSNRFSDENKIRIWSGHQFCQNCGSNQGCSLHHIRGTVSGSILNSIMLCNRCHKIADSKNIGNNNETIAFQQRYIDITSEIIKEEYYTLAKKDFLFITNCKEKGIVIQLE